MATHITTPTTLPAITPVTLEEASSPLVMCALLVLSGDMYTVVVDNEVVDITAVLLVNVSLLVVDTSDITLVAVALLDVLMMDNVDATIVDIISVDVTDITSTELVAVVAMTNGVTVVNDAIDDTYIVADVLRPPMTQQKGFIASNRTN